MQMRKILNFNLIKQRVINLLLDSPQEPELRQLGMVAAQEVNVIHSVFEQLGIKAEINVAKVTASATGNFIRYPLLMAGRISSITAIEADLCTAISMHRGAETEVHIRQPMLAIELPYPLATRPLLWSDAKLGALKPHQALLGMDYSLDTPRPCIIDYGKRTVAHSLTSGATGSGKSVLMIGKLTSLAASTSPDDLLLIFLDPKFDPDWRTLSDLPHVVMCSEPADCVAAIASVKAELERRKRHPDKRKLILIIDEYADFLGDLDKETAGQVETQIRSITSVGRSLGIHLDLITQKPTTEIVDTVAKGNLTTRCGGMVMSAKESEIAMNRGGIGCEALPGEGSFYVVIGGGRVQRIQSYLIEGEALETAIDAINAQWNNVEPYRIAMVEPAETAKSISAAQNIDDINAERILDHFSPAELFDDSGAIRKGMQLAAVKVLFGGDAENAGTPRRATVRALEIIKDHIMES